MKTAILSMMAMAAATVVGVQSAHADGCHTPPAYNPPAYTAPVYMAPTAAPVYQVGYRPGYHEAAVVQPTYTAPRYERPWENPYVREQVRAERHQFREWERSQWAQEDAKQANERAWFAQRHGWNHHEMRRFERRQAEERAEFGAYMEQQRAQNLDQLAARYGEWVRYHARDWS